MASDDTLRPWLIAFLGGLGCCIIIAWNVEAWSIGRGVVSTWVGPFGPAAILAALYLRLRSR